ncbi:SPARC-related modular calcium-binding protein 2 isoform X1 [Cimex lectularius]|uniref:Uncharacterized protein n=1 Tax=Cimex lectularius TaxID=79782 RepID=A0A8I6TEG1_CIMLE|nr:SPARC-related modular calcium-binding protein 2 isoform X1 [Cimex lectularius]
MIQTIIFIFFLPSLVKGSCEGKIATCEGRNPPRLVCGSNGITYTTRCHLLKAMCAGKPGLRVAHKGPCTSKQPCWANEDTRADEEGLTFRPKCLSDGRYAPVQCHESTGYCWCVTEHGKPISNTSVRNTKPKCNRRGKQRIGSTRGLKQKKGCGRLERANFITNLIRIFKTEYGRINEEPMNATHDEMVQLAVRWKFDTLDGDENKTLTRDEYIDLKKIIRKVVRPKKCAHSFIRYCDLNRDSILTLQEWENCLQKPTVRRKKNKLTKNKERDFGVVQDSVSLLSANFSGLGVEEQSERKDEPEINDCWSDRNSVLEEQQGGLAKLYIPECTNDGRYKKIQCYTSTGYCWCVHEDTGKPIPGTSTREPYPKCDAVQPPPRPMKGCSENTKRVFLNDLLAFFKHMKVIQGTTSADKTAILKEDQSTAEKESIAQWYFYQLDINKNKVLDRKEWKTFRSTIAQHNRLRHCGKKLPRYCDVNHDRKISITEWFNCLSIHEETSKTVVSTTSQKRRGPNPLESLLHDD